LRRQGIRISGKCLSKILRRCAPQDDREVKAPQDDREVKAPQDDREVKAPQDNWEAALKCPGQGDIIEISIKENIRCFSQEHITVMN